MANVAGVALALWSTIDDNAVQESPSVAGAREGCNGLRLGRSLLAPPGLDPELAVGDGENLVVEVEVEGQG